MKRKFLIYVTLLAALSLVGCTNSKEISRNTETPSDSTAVVIEKEQVETYDIETNHGVFKYPIVWQDVVRVDENDNQVVFYGSVGSHEEEVLFTLEFGESDGYLLGTLNGEELHIVDSDVNFDQNWSEDEELLLTGMQEDFNVILEDLMSRDDFELASKKQ